MIFVNKPNLRKLIIFAVITLTSGWLGVLLNLVLDKQSEENSLGMGIWLILPFLTGIILRIVHNDWKDMGIKLHLRNNIKWYLLSIAIYPLVTIITVGLAKIFGCIEISEFGMRSFFSLAAASIAGGLIKNIFEEFAWRGYLTPKLMGLKLNDWFIYIISGLIWALWHAAYYIVFLPDRYFETTSRVEMLLMGCILMTCWAVMYVEIYRLTKSVWPGVLMHAVEDAFPNILVMAGGFISFTKLGDVLLNPITGVFSTALFLGIGLLLRTFRINKERMQPVQNLVKVD